MTLNKIKIVFSTIIEIIKSILGFIKKVIMLPFTAYHELKNNREYYELRGRRAVHGREKGNESMKKALERRGEIK